MHEKLVVPSSIPLTGLLTAGKYVDLKWPEEAEFDLITHLRNEPTVRKWFIDDSMLDLAKNRIWLADTSKRPRDALLTIALRLDQKFIGTIGWTDWDIENGIASFGRVTCDFAAVREIKKRGDVPNSVNLILDAYLALRRLVFEEGGLVLAQATVMTGNEPAVRLIRLCGFRMIGQSDVIRPDGKHVQISKFELDKATYFNLKGK